MTTTTQDRPPLSLGSAFGLSFATIVIFAAGMLLGVISGLCSAWVATQLWGWFIVPLFALPALPLVNAYGVMLIFNCLRAPPKPPEDQKPLRTIAVRFAALAMVWLIGFLLHRYGAPWPWNGVA